MAILLVHSSCVLAHDDWVQPNTNVVRAGDTIHFDLMLGNHGNNHRDFKIAGKINLAGSTLEVIDPTGKHYDMKDRLVDMGYTPKEGFWTASFAGDKEGIYVVGHTSEQVVSYAPKRTVKSAKTYFVVSKSLDKVAMANPGFDRPLGHPFELVPESNPVTPMGPGKPIKVRLLYKNKPLPRAMVSFIPRGETLTEDFDHRYERMTDGDGRASYTPTMANYYLIVAHWDEPNEKGKDYDGTKYSATLTVLVPNICPCCNN